MLNFSSRYFNVLFCVYFCLILKYVMDVGKVRYAGLKEAMLTEGLAW